MSSDIYERLEVSHQEICVNTLDRRRQRRLTSLKVRQRSLGQLNGDYERADDLIVANRQLRDCSGRCPFEIPSHSRQVSSNDVIDPLRRDAEIAYVRQYRPNDDGRMTGQWRRNFDKCVADNCKHDDDQLDEEGGRRARFNRCHSTVVMSAASNNDLLAQRNCDETPAFGASNCLKTRGTDNVMRVNSLYSRDGIQGNFDAFQF
jgi:hypothetical protein